MEIRKFDYRRITPHLLAIAALFLINIMYFYPQLEGKRIEAADSIAFEAWKGELKDYAKGETYHWNNAMFSGMPWHLLVLGRENNFTRFIDDFLEFGFQAPIKLFLKMSICCYLALIFLGISPLIALMGSIAFGLNVNFIVLMGAGHQAKLDVIAYFPLIVSGLILCLRNKFIPGAILIASSTSLAIFGNHIQMVYYLLLALVVFVASYLISYIKQKKVVEFAKIGLIALVAAGIGAICNFAQLHSSQSFSHDTMRGKPILENANDGNATSSSQVDGLEWNYAMQWSNDFTDLFSMLIPRVVGGSSSEEVDPSTAIGQLLKSNGAPIKADGNYQAPMYWGALPFTAGPYYLGATLLLLFTLSLFIVDRNLRYGMLGAFILVSVLSMGSNFSIVNRTLFDYVPLFNKFRAPNSAVNLLPVFVVLTAMIGLQQVLTRKNHEFLLKRLWYSTAITGGICLLFILFGDLFLSYSGAAAEAQYPPNIQEVFRESRRSIMRSDAMRSLAIVVMTVGMLWAYLRQKLDSKYAILIGLILLVTIDHWTVDRRYIDSGNFISTRDFMAKLTPRPVDNQIVQSEPQGRINYRVFDLSISSFNSAETSFHHNTIGGYHPAKLQRYQDLIDYYISKGNQQVLNMLNTKYVIQRDQSVQTNNQALGNGWFVNDVVFVDTPNEEIEKLGNIQTNSQAVVLRNEFSETLSGFSPGNGIGSINLVEYEPNHLVYNTSTNEDQLAVFSEVWYPGWKVTIDGNPAAIIRANYSLRSLRVPAGQHTIDFSYNPVAKGSIVSGISSTLLLLGILFGAIFLIRREEDVLAGSEVDLVKPTKVSTKRIAKSTSKKVSRKSRKDSRK